MFRILLVLAVIAIGYDAVINQGTYTRQTWDGIVNMGGSVVDGARNLGNEARNEPAQPSN